MPREENRVIRIVPALLIALLGIAAYWNSFEGQFVHKDELESIVDNPHIRRLWPLSSAISLPLFDTGATVDRRPLLSLSFAINYALLGPDAWGFHLGNLLIHMGVALLVFGIVRRTLLRFDSVAPRARPLAFAVAALWIVHPLNTQAVTYMVQRAESLLGFWIALTLYCAIRGFEGGALARRWLAGSATACALGMASKEAMLATPVLVLLYDGIFFSRSYRAALLARPHFYAWLASTWVVLACILAVTINDVMFDFRSRSLTRYWSTQPGVILHYLRLCVWPWPLLTDYDWPLAAGVSDAILPILVVAGLAAVTAWGLVRRQPLAFLGACLFGVLAPTSFAATMDLIQEHRMYTPLSAMTVGVVLALDRALSAIGPVRTRQVVAGVALAAAVATLSWLTRTRNSDYHDPVGFWEKAVADRPDSPSSRYALAGWYVRAGNRDDAIVQLEEALELSYLEHYSPDPTIARGLVVSLYIATGRADEAEAFLRDPLGDDPGDFDLLRMLGDARVAQGRDREAALAYRRALDLRFDLPRAHYGLARALVRLDDLREALAHLEHAVSLAPDYADALAEQQRVRDLYRARSAGSG